MTPREFWICTYLAAIAKGMNSDDARSTAYAALEDLMELERHLDAAKDP